MAEKQGLSARDLLQEVYNTFTKEGKEVNFPKKALAEIANDSDWHRTRTGYTGYESATLLKIGQNEWIIALGIACGHYPADPYNCDIAAIPFLSDGKSEEQIANEIHQALEQNDYFRHLIIGAMANGQLFANEKSSFGTKILEILGPKLPELITQELEIDPNCFTLDLRPVVKSPVRYTEELATLLYTTLLTILKP